MNKLRNLPLYRKINLIYIAANVLVLAVNVILLAGVNSMAYEIDMVYQENLELNELAICLENVQDSMTDYLNSKTSDSLEDYYRSEQEYRNMVNEMGETVTELSFTRMERNIRNMSENYLDIVAQTVEAKRGRNVEKYRVRYESATELYEYISDYIVSLNNEQFMHNSVHYNELSKVFRSFETVSMIVIFLVIVTNVIIITRFVGGKIQPLKQLATAADEVAKGNFDIALLEVNAEDEIGVVTNAFNQMVINIRKYIAQIKERMEVERALKEKELLMETHLKDAQLKYLQAQINPHFLFNTLNAGVQLAMMEGAERTYTYVRNMAEFFRYNVKKGNETVTLREEIELVDNYIYILNVRFSGEIHYEKELDESLLDIRMPGMILQPIVENSVNHGIREMEGAGIIRLSVYAMGDEVCISVKDNGKGIAEEDIQSILDGSYRKKRSKSASNGIGMDNVIARLKLFTENEDVISLVSEGENKGTEVILYLQTKEEPEDV